MFSLLPNVIHHTQAFVINVGTLGILFDVIQKYGVIAHQEGIIRIKP
jgi:hypothetical protein